MSVENRRRFVLGCLLLGVYLLVYVPEVNSDDGRALLAVTAAAIRHGAPEIGVMGALDALQPLQMSRMGAFGEDGALYAKKGPTPSLALVPLALLAEALPWLNLRAAAMLFNPLVTAAAALALYTLARGLNFRPRTAFITALVYGLATMAVVYVKTLFGEPLAGLLLMLAALAVWKTRAGQSQSSARRLWLAAGGSCLGLLAGVNLVYMLAAPVIGAFVFVPRFQPLTRPGRLWPGRETRRDLAALGLPVLATLALLGLYNLARFGSPFNSGYHFAAGEGFTQPFLTGLYGLTISPYRGLFWYNPALLLAIPGWLVLQRRAPWAAWLALALAALQMLMFAGWWSWHGGIVWGPRFLIPALPWLALMLAPLIEAAWTRPALAGALVGMVGLSVGVQVLGALYSFYPYIGYLYTHYYTGVVDAPVSGLADAVLTDPALSPIIGTLAFARAGLPPEPAWLSGGVDGLHLLAALMLVVLPWPLLILTARTKARRFAPAILAAAVLVVLSLTAARQNDSPEAEKLAALEQALQPPGTVVAASALWGESLLDLDRRWRVFSTNAPTAPDDPLAAPLWGCALRQGDRLWLLTWFAPGDPANWQERDLWERAAFVVERAVPDHRALLFDLSPAPADHPAGHRFGDIRLKAYGAARSAGSLRVTLEWSADAPLSGDYAWFVHLLDENGDILAQQDRAPLGGYAPTSGWQPSLAVTDRLAFLGDFPAGVRLRLGWVNPATGERLPAWDAGGTPLEAGFAVLETAGGS